MTPTLNNSITAIDILMKTKQKKKGLRQCAKQQDLGDCDCYKGNFSLCNCQNRKNSIQALLNSTLLCY